MENGVQKVKTSKINDINLLRWKEYDEIITDSLWVLDKRDTSGAHFGWYWGNFIPQIPHQMMLRYTKKGDWVLDTFVGSGTTGLVAKKLGRNFILIDNAKEYCELTKKRLERELQPSLFGGDISKIEVMTYEKLKNRTQKSLDVIVAEKRQRYTISRKRQN